MLNDAELMKQRRIQTLKNSILAQLGVSDAAQEADNEPLPGEEEMKATFNALRSASASLDREKEKRCHSDDFYAKPVSSFVGVVSEDIVFGGRVRREVPATGAQQINNLLHSYTIAFNFSLPSTLTDISRADLLLYQQDSVKPDTTIKDRRQYVEIRTVLDSINQKFVVEGKYIDIYETGYQVFEITSAIRMWIARQVEGPVSLEVNIYCYSSPNCSQPEGALQPASVSFLSSPSEQDKAPRIITVSKNPLDVEHQERQRRNADRMSGVGACTANRSTCCLKSFELSFHEDLGLNFILLPENFTANYCEGVCPELMGGQLMTPRIYELFSRLPETNPGSSVEPCCTGNQYKSQEVLVRRRGELIIEELAHVTVTSCRCA
jgi:hypothetical protein